MWGAWWWGGRELLSCRRPTGSEFGRKGGIQIVSKWLVQVQNRKIKGSWRRKNHGNRNSVLSLNDIAA